jgi:hypothetical protein
VGQQTLTTDIWQGRFDELFSLPVRQELMETYYQTFGTDLFLEGREDGETRYGLE